MRGPCGLACAGGHTVVLSRYSACHQGILETLYVGLHAAPLAAAADNNNNKTPLAVVEEQPHPQKLLGSFEAGGYYCICRIAEQSEA